MKAFRLCVTLFISVFFLSAVASNPFARTPQLAQRVLAQQRARNQQIVKQLRQTLHNQPKAQQTVVTGYERFEHTPGFISVLEKITQQASNPGGLKGCLFEVEKALTIHNRHTEQQPSSTVLGFGQIRRSPKNDTKREFDIVAQRGKILFYYECKNINWGASIKDNCMQFHDQYRIVQDLKSHYGIDIRYIVCSKQPITDKWKEFFQKHEILFEQEQDYDTES